MSSRRGKTMRESTAAELYQAAHETWTAMADPDRPRSEQYQAADEILSRGHHGDAIRARAGNWVRTLHRYETFWWHHGRSPRENTRNRSSLSSVERRLGEWARYQRRFETDLCGYQHVRLSASPAFVWDPHDSVWFQQLERCCDQAVRNQRLPYLNSQDPVEFAAARWLNRQIMHLREQRLNPDRRRKLHALLASRRVHHLAGADEVSDQVVPVDSALVTPRT